MKAKHTPGPWDTGIPTTRVNAPRPEGWRVDLCVADCHPEGYAVEKEAERVANAALIAAAPDLLEALRFVLYQIAPGDAHGRQCVLYSDCLSPNPNDSETVVDYLRNVIAKAQGFWP